MSNTLRSLGLATRCLLGTCPKHGMVWAFDAVTERDPHYFLCPTDGIRFVRVERWLPWPECVEGVE